MLAISPEEYYQIIISDLRLQLDKANAQLQRKEKEPDWSESTTGLLES